MQSLQTSEQTFSLPTLQPLRTNSTIGELSLTSTLLPFDALGKDASHIFMQNPMLSGILLMDREQLMGMISRRRFLEQMSRPYSLELFLERPLSALYPFIDTHPLTLPSSTPVVEATQYALQRETDLLHEPLLVQRALDEDESQTSKYQVLDMHQLLIAYSEIHRLTTQLLKEKTQAHLVQTEKMASLGRMIAGVSHEIKNPVNCVSGNLEFLEKYVNDLFSLLAAYRETQASSIPKLKNLEKKIDLAFLLQDLPSLIESMSLASERLVDIVSSLRNFSRMDHEKKQQVDLHRYLDGTLMILDSRIKLGISIEKQYGDIPLLECYPGQVSQVFINLISNSIDALLEKEVSRTIDSSGTSAHSNARFASSEISLSEEWEEWQPLICISTHHQLTQTGEEIVVRIWDNGDGISDDIKEQIFDPFFTTKSVDHGTGLGLSISYQIITEKHGGWIRVESSQETGTLFEIGLPC